MGKIPAQRKLDRAFRGGLAKQRLVLLSADLCARRTGPKPHDVAAFHRRFAIPASSCRAFMWEAKPGRETGVQQPLPAYSRKRAALAAPIGDIDGYHAVTTTSLPLTSTS